MINPAPYSTAKMKTSFYFYRKFPELQAKYRGSRPSQVKAKVEVE
jgi:hypothetical protein